MTACLLLIHPFFQLQLSTLILFPLMEYFDIDLSAQLTRQGPIKFNADAKDKEEKRIQQTYCLMGDGGLSFLPTLE